MRERAKAVDEVMGRLIGTGQTYLPGSAATVLVEYTIVDTDQAERELRAFRADAGLVAGTTPGFIGENLYRVRFDGEPDEGLRRFVNVGHWTNRGAFDAKFGTNPTILPGPLQPFERLSRRRGWLVRGDGPEG